MASASEHDPLSRPRAVSLPPSFAPPIRFLGFWTAIISPFILMSVVGAGVTTQYPLVVATVLFANIAGLVIGRNYSL